MVETLTEVILAAKKERGLTFEEIGTKLGRDKTWAAAAIMGQASMSREEAMIFADLFDLDETAVAELQEYKLKGVLDQKIPTDPLIYRFHEINQVYGTTLKAVIQEMFGDGIMSAIDFSMDIQKKEDPNGDRVVVTYEGKFLPYKKWHG